MTANLGLAFVALGHRVALFDCDIENPNLARALGLDDAPFDLDTEKERFIPYKADGWELFSLAPFWGQGAVLWHGQDRVAKIGQESKSLKGTGLGSLVQQLLSVVDWSAPDIMLLDLPPTSGDVIQGLFEYVGQQIWGVLLVAQPTPLAADDMVRNISLLKHFQIPLIGLVENMSSFLAPDTGKRYSPIFVSGQIDLKEFCKQNKVAYLGEIPLCPDIATLKPIYASLASTILEAKPAQIWKRGLVHDVGLRVKVRAAKGAAKILAGGSHGDRGAA